jgi:hypothetical protein
LTIAKDNPFFSDDESDQGDEEDDDEDQSWKIRRAALRAVQALLHSVGPTPLATQLVSSAAPIVF